MTKRTCTGSEQIASSSKQTELLEEQRPESADFAEFEKAALEFRNELVRRALKKTDRRIG